MWPKFEDSTVGEHLAFTGAVKDDILDIVLLAQNLAEIISGVKPESLLRRFKLTGALPEQGNELLRLIGRKRGMLLPGGEIDMERAAVMLLDEFRGGKLGRITLEMPKN